MEEWAKQIRLEACVEIKEIINLHKVTHVRRKGKTVRVSQENRTNKLVDEIQRSISEKFYQ